jgi:hypothetical protein
MTTNAGLGMLRLQSLLYLPMTDDGTQLTEPTEIRARVDRPSAYSSHVVTVAPFMAGSHRVELYRASVPSRKVPGDVQAVVDEFNADIEYGWRFLLGELAEREINAASARRAAADADFDRWVRFARQFG